MDPEPEDAKADELRRSVKHAVAIAITQLPKTLTLAEVRAEKAKMIANMRNSGVEDGEDIFRELFPNL